MANATQETVRVILSVDGQRTVPIPLPQSTVDKWLEELKANLTTPEIVSVKIDGKTKEISLEQASTMVDMGFMSAERFEELTSPVLYKESTVGSQHHRVFGIAIRPFRDLVKSVRDAEDITGNDKDSRALLYHGCAVELISQGKLKASHLEGLNKFLTDLGAGTVSL